MAGCGADWALPQTQGPPSRRMFLNPTDCTNIISQEISTKVLEPCEMDLLSVREIFGQSKDTPCERPA